MLTNREVENESELREGERERELMDFGQGKTSRVGPLGHTNSD